MKIEKGNGKLWGYIDGKWIVKMKETNIPESDDIRINLHSLTEGFVRLEERVSKLERPGFPIERLNRQAECLEEIFSKLDKLGEGFLLLEERVSKVEKRLEKLEYVSQHFDARLLNERLKSLRDELKKLVQTQESSEVEKFGFKGEISAMDDIIMDMQNDITELQQKQQLQRMAINDLSFKVDKVVHDREQAWMKRRMEEPE